MEVAGAEGVGAGDPHPATTEAPAVVGAEQGRVPGFLQEEAGAAMRAKVVEDDDLALVVADHDVTEDPGQAQEVAIRRKLGAMRHQVPEAARQVAVQGGAGHRVLAGAA